MMILIKRWQPSSNYFFQDDTINLFAYAVQRLSPRALSSGGSSWSYLRRGSTPSHVVVGPTFATVSVSDQFHHLPANSPSQDNSYHVKRPLQHNRWSKGKDGFLVTDIWGTETGSLIPSTPTIWLQQTGERMYLCAYQYKSLTLILLVPLSSILNGEQGVSLVKQQVLENVSDYLSNWILSLLLILFCLFSPVVNFFILFVCCSSSILIGF